MPIVTDVRVVDASALAAILFGEPEGARVAALLADARLVAPHLQAFELANVCVVKCLRHADRRAAIRRAFGLRTRLAIAELAVDQAGVVDLALATGLTAYDASYLWLVKELAAPLVTLDRKLEQAALGLVPRAD
ncbi:Predicted nucleic acid-binding protein, contains PIN domain [Tistlia consotensis]|uniref:Ribonuclease VapC n=1 Tax=Tistlia consotensis USBA 355 TaxID=560819 RepID=A0A1Y6B9J5_9PROT|nr:type II toxin-antitoxin system VapC family toxin [Tistlia consotensis]SMF00072.1 Predicted nucleic acid-binding protein, contains PIN domain [Tistlia consotensis USBA 355]SNR76332.1 Predicted nucleic acid-binding protein, contains PIN domain [Tistlia consotensis]